MRRVVYIGVGCLLLAALVYGAHLSTEIAARDIAKACKQAKRFTVGGESFACSLEKSR